MKTVKSIEFSNLHTNTPYLIVRLVATRSIFSVSIPEIGFRDDLNYLEKVIEEKTLIIEWDHDITIAYNVYCDCDCHYFSDDIVSSYTIVYVNEYGQKADATVSYN